MNALVGSLGMSTSAAGGSLTPQWGAGANRTAGNILRCLVAGSGHSTLPTTPAGWTVVNAVSYGSPAYNSVTLLTLTASGADSAPTIAGIAGITWTVVLAEYVADPVPPAPLTKLQEIEDAVGATLAPGDQVGVFLQPASKVLTVQADGTLA